MPTPRVPLTRSRVLASAITLADAEGLEAVSMRRLAETLSVVPMALYKHVADKEDLVNGMVDTVIEVFTASEPASDDWQGVVRERTMAARAAVLAHPWLRRAIETRTTRTIAVLRHMEALTSAMLAGGMDANLVHHAMHTLGNRIWGFSPEMFDETRQPTSKQAGPPPDPSEFPGIMAVAMDAQERRPGKGCDEEFEFEFALTLILDGVARLAATE
ncbi:TetR/AcrR family transcriptional regulator [Aestuariimicrobium kwangyangense]|uniref:TetR/AcrR family transcriptional regulator n=1 Tax=Aestuariimicrobium kwangyangense TaxID=396389 RepID=UPI0003B3FDF8|nr:TetR/AcrR family transcriptional regulator C-terminal domain-containing protein [Aestuariimicrobium kwangyangense]